MPRKATADYWYYRWRRTVAQVPRNFCFFSEQNLHCFFLQPLDVVCVAEDGTVDITTRASTSIVPIPHNTRNLPIDQETVVSLAKKRRRRQIAQSADKGL
jgi:hypothetical protein